MRKILIFILAFIYFSTFAQTHIEYISEPADSMALINKMDINIINNVFNERNTLDSLYNLNEQIISVLEQESNVKDSIILNQNIIIENKELVINELEDKTGQIAESYNKKLKREKNKTISFQALTGAGIITIILLILL